MPAISRETGEDHPFAFHIETTPLRCDRLIFSESFASFAATGYAVSHDRTRGGFVIRILRPLPSTNAMGTHSGFFLIYSQHGYIV